MASTSSQAELAHSAEKTKKFVLVVGSGVHHFVRDGNDPGILASWNLLLDAVEREASYPPGNPLLPPSARWEEMLLAKVKIDLAKKRRAGAIHVRERALRRRAGKLITARLDDYKVKQEKALIFRGKHISDIVSLNFEASWLGQGASRLKVRIPPRYPAFYEEGIGASPAFAVEANRLYSRAQIENGPRIWFPNGHVGQPESLRLGFRDFGLQAGLLRYAFERFKIWEKSVLQKTRKQDDGGPRSEAAYRQLLSAYFSSTREGENSLMEADHWVAAFMLLEPIFLGVGMSPDEQGLWWLLHQRARNLARVPSARPPRILKICPPCIEAEYGRFLSGSPVLEPIWCRTWEDGWDTVEAILAGNSD